MNIRSLIPKPVRRKLRFAYWRTRNLLLHKDPWYITGVNIEISTTCNRSCSYCPVSLGPPAKQKLISEETLDLIISRLKEIHYRGLIDVIHYNEPMLSPDLDMVCHRICKHLPLATLHITTNGDKLTPNRAREIFQYTGVKQFNVTRHPPYSSEWDRQIADVRRLYPKYINFIASPGDEAWTNRGGLVSIPGPNGIDGSCNAPEAVNITIDGKVIMCCCDFYKKHVVGDLKYQSIHEIYYSAGWALIRKEVRHGIARLPICQACMINHKVP